MDKTALFNLSYGMYVVSTKDGDRDVGCVVNSVFQVTSSPATLALSINKDNYTNECIIKHGKFVVSILSENVSKDIIGTFGFSSSRDRNKFDNLKFTKTQENIPVLTEGVCGFIECRNMQTVDFFTHTLVLAEIVNAEKINTEPPMSYNYYHKVIKGKSPKNAPTFIEEIKTDEKKYTCSICGFEYPGTKSEFEALSATYVCPVCGAPKSMFELV